MAGRGKGAGEEPSDERRAVVILEQMKAEFRAFREGQKGLTREVREYRESTEARLRELKEFTMGGFKKVWEEFGGVNRRLDDTNQRLDDTNRLLDDTNKRLGDTNSRLGELVGRFDAHERAHAN